MRGVVVKEPAVFAGSSNSHIPVESKDRRWQSLLAVSNPDVSMSTLAELMGNADAAMIIRGILTGYAAKLGLGLETIFTNPDLRFWDLDDAKPYKLSLRWTTHVIQKAKLEHYPDILTAIQTRKDKPEVGENAAIAKSAEKIMIAPSKVSDVEAFNITAFTEGELLSVMPRMTNRTMLYLLSVAIRSLGMDNCIGKRVTTHTNNNTSGVVMVCELHDAVITVSCNIIYFGFWRSTHTPHPHR